MSAAGGSGGRARRIRRLEPAAVLGVMSRDATVFRRMWVPTTFTSVLEPTIYLLALGLGLGTLIKEVAGLTYVQFVGTGIVGSAVLFASMLPSMYGSFIKRRFQRTYDAMLAAPVDVEELVTAEMGWIGLRAGTYAMAPLIVTLFFGLPIEPTIVLVPFIGVLTGFGFAGLGLFISGSVESLNNFDYVTSAVITPLFLVSGVFFPIDQLPQWAQIASEFNPLYQCVTLVRHAVLGVAATDLLRALMLVAFALLTWRLAIARTRRALID